MKRNKSVCTFRNKIKLNTHISNTIFMYIEKVVRNVKVKIITLMVYLFLYRKIQKIIFVYKFVYIIQ